MVGSFREFSSCPGSLLSLEGWDQNIGCPLRPVNFVVLLSKPQFLNNQEAIYTSIVLAAVDLTIVIELHSMHFEIQSMAKRAASLKIVVILEVKFL